MELVDLMVGMKLKIFWFYPWANSRAFCLARAVFLFDMVRSVLVKNFVVLYFTQHSRTQTDSTHSWRMISKGRLFGSMWKDIDLQVTKSIQSPRREVLPHPERERRIWWRIKLTRERATNRRVESSWERGLQLGFRWKSFQRLYIEVNGYVI